MRRDIQNFVERGEKIIRMNERCDLTIGEFHQLLDNFKRVEAEKGTFDAVWEAIVDSFLIGVAVGAGCENKKQAKRVRCSRDTQQRENTFQIE